jgi:hypothetical protein
MSMEPASGRFAGRRRSSRRPRPRTLATARAAADVRLRLARRAVVEIEVHDGHHHERHPVWVVRVGDRLFVRARRGIRRSWYRRLIRRGDVILGADDLRVRAIADHVEDAVTVAAVSGAYAHKYRHDPSLPRMFLPRARRSTLELLLLAEDAAPSA